MGKLVEKIIGFSYFSCIQAGFFKSKFCFFGTMSEAFFIIILFAY